MLRQNHFSSDTGRLLTRQSIHINDVFIVIVSDEVNCSLVKLLKFLPFDHLFLLELLRPFFLLFFLLGFLVYDLLNGHQLLLLLGINFLDGFLQILQLLQMPDDSVIFQGSLKVLRVDSFFGVALTHNVGFVRDPDNII